MTALEDSGNGLECVFCKIVAGELPCFEICQDRHTLAFMDINPASQGHVLVIPKAHYANLYEMPDSELGHVMATLRKVAGAVNRYTRPHGVSIVQANGPGAAQSVMHYHCHIVPRWKGDEMKINWGLVPGDMDRIGAVAAKIREALE